MTPQHEGKLSGRRFNRIRDAIIANYQRRAGRIVIRATWTLPLLSAQQSDAAPKHHGNQRQQHQERENPVGHD